MPGDPRLRHLQDFDKETHANLVVTHQVDEAEAVAIGQRDEEFFKVEFSVGSAHNIYIISQITFVLTHIFFTATLISRSPVGA